MAGDEPPSSASTAAVSCSVGESIPSPLTQDPVGSPSHDVPEIQSLTSEDDHEQGHEGNQDHAVRAAVLSEDLKQRIIKQVTLPPLPSLLSTALQIWTSNLFPSLGLVRHEVLESPIWIAMEICGYNFS